LYTRSGALVNFNLQKNLQKFAKQFKMSKKAF